ncbi:MAG: DNRLRE domain-containing protein [Verrucomicrobium sp.]|nr:DNRLRE domain-containing protein [Verrucomicrobium sp.]
MTPPQNPKNEVLELCDRLLNGGDEFRPEDRDRLEALVIGDPSARRTYVEYLQLHSALGEIRFKEGSLAEVVNMPLTGPSARPLKTTAWWGRGLAAAAAVTILAAGWGMGRWQGQGAAGKASGPSLAKLVDVKGARWDGGSLPTEVGALLSSGRLRLAAGLATLEFNKGARLTLEGPADLELITQDKCFLHSGALTAHVPPPAVGFIVETTHARLVDHGTDFGISAGADGEAQVQVFEGEVELEHHRSGERVNLHTRQAASVSEEELTRSGQAGGYLESERPDTRRNKPEKADVVSLTTASGRGQAGYVWSPDTKTHFSDSLLLLKHTAQTACRRKAWLGFDLSSLQGREITSASLTLTFEPTGWGYASLLPDCVFAVYGMTDDTLDAWTEEDLNWDNAPANDPASAGVLPGRAVKLGTFVIPQGEAAGAYSIRGPELAQFLTQDRNLYATLVVVRETPETVGGGLVHGFAGNHHPTLKPPTLRLVLD